MSEAERWGSALVTWAIPPEILAAAPESPWGFSTELFARKADEAGAELSPSTQVARAALPIGGSVLDVGCGAGAGALPLAATAAQCIGVDTSAAMLQAFQLRADLLGVPLIAIEGAWPDVADRTPVADVVVCHNVAYNVQYLAPFVQRLTDHARHRVVLELHAEHPMSNLDDLWLHFHSLQRPTSPTVDDAVALLRELGLEPERLDWSASGPGWAEKKDLIAWVRRRICLSPERDAEIEAALESRILLQGGVWRMPPRTVATLWWNGSAR